MTGGLTIFEDIAISVASDCAKNAFDSLVKFFGIKDKKIKGEIENLLIDFYKYYVEQNDDIKIDFGKFCDYITSDSFYKSIFESFIGEKDIDDIKKTASVYFGSNNKDTDMFIDKLSEILRKSIEDNISYDEKYLSNKSIEANANNTARIEEKIDILSEIVTDANKGNESENFFANDRLRQIKKNMDDWRLSEARIQISESIKDQDQLSGEQKDEILYYDSLINYRLNKYNIVKENSKKFKNENVWYLKNEELICFIDKDFQKFCNNLDKMKLSEDEQCIRKIMFKCFYKKEDVKNEINENFLKEGISSDIFNYRYINLLCGVYYQSTDLTKTLSYLEAEYNVTKNAYDKLNVQLCKTDLFFYNQKKDVANQIYNELNDFSYIVDFLGKETKIKFWNTKLKLAQLSSFENVISIFNSIPVDIINEKEILFLFHHVFLKNDNYDIYLVSLYDKLYDKNFYKDVINFDIKILLKKYDGIDELYYSCLEKYDSELRESINFIWYMYKSDCGCYCEIKDELHKEVSKMWIEGYGSLLDVATENNDKDLVNKIIDLLNDSEFEDLNYFKYIIRNLIKNKYYIETRRLLINYLDNDEEIVSLYIDTFDFDVLTNSEFINSDRTECLNALQELHKNGIKNKTLLYNLMLLELYDGCYTDTFLKISNEYKSLYGIDNYYIDLLFKFLIKENKLDIETDEEIEFILRSGDKNLKLNLLNYFIKKEDYKEAIDLFIDLIINMDKFDEFDEFFERLFITNSELSSRIYNNSIDLSIKSVKPNCVINLDGDIILIYKNNTKITDEKEFNCTFMNENDELAVVLKEKTVGETIKCNGKEKEIKEILSFYEYFTIYLNEFYWTKYKKEKKVILFKIDPESDDIISKFIEALKPFDNKEHEEMKIDLYSKGMLPLSCTGFEYYKELIMISINNKIFINYNKSVELRFLDKNAEFLPSLHTIIYLHVAGLLEKLLPIKDKIVIHNNIKKEIVLYVKEAKKFEKNVSATMALDDKGQISFNDIKNNNFKHSDFLTEILNIINNFKIVENQSDIDYEKYSEIKKIVNEIDIDVFDMVSKNENYYFICDSLALSSFYEIINGDKRNIASLDLLLLLTHEPDQIKYHIEILTSFAKINYLFAISNNFFKNMILYTSHKEKKYINELIGLLEELYNLLKCDNENDRFIHNRKLVREAITEYENIIKKKQLVL